MAMCEPYRWVCVSIVASSFATAAEHETISNAPRTFALRVNSSTLIHLRVSDHRSSIAPHRSQRIADFRLFPPEVGYLIQVNVCRFAWRHSEKRCIVLHSAPVHGVSNI